MKKLIGALVLSMGLIFTSTVIAKSDKVTICHVPAGNPSNAHSITISKNALKAHLGDNNEGLHGGDYYGECNNEEPTPAPTPEPTPVTTPEPTPEVTLEPTPEVTPEPTPDVPSGGAPDAPKMTLPPTDTE